MLKRTTAAATRRFASGSRSPRARLPTWSWFCAAATMRAPFRPPQLGGDLRHRAVEARVVAVLLAGERDVERVVEAVEPHRVVAPVGQRPEVGGAHLADHERVGIDGANAVGELGEHVRGRVVVDGVHGVEAEAVEPVVAHPQLGVLDRPLAHAGLRVVERVAPGRLAEPVGEVGAERAQRLVAGADVVVDDVEDDAEALAVRCVDEPRQSLRAAVGRRAARRCRGRRSPSRARRGTSRPASARSPSRPTRAARASARRRRRTFPPARRCRRGARRGRARRARASAPARSRSVVSRTRDGPRTPSGCQREHGSGQSSPSTVKR